MNQKWNVYQAYTTWAHIGTVEAPTYAEAQQQARNIEHDSFLTPSTDLDVFEADTSKPRDVEPWDAEDRYWDSSMTTEERDKLKDRLGCYK